jgi:hypothetical protein
MYGLNRWVAIVLSMNEEYQHQFQGGQIPNIPSCSGLYAWYYKPLVIDEATIIGTLTSFLNNPVEVGVEVNMRYGLKLVSTSALKAQFGSQKQSSLEVINQAIEKSDEFFINFFQSEAVKNFSRPIYIGIAKNLNTRVYGQHYMNLVEMYDMDSPVNRFLSIYPNSTMQEVMNTLSLPHSFALEARVRNIAPRDLQVNIFKTTSLPVDIGTDGDDPDTETPARRALERILQLIADPICGRR